MVHKFRRPNLEVQLDAELSLARDGVPVHTGRRAGSDQRGTVGDGGAIHAVGLAVKDAADLVSRRIVVVKVENVEKRHLRLEHNAFGKGVQYAIQA